MSGQDIVELVHCSNKVAGLLEMNSFKRIYYQRKLLKLFQEQQLRNLLQQLSQIGLEQKRVLRKQLHKTKI